MLKIGDFIGGTAFGFRRARGHTGGHPIINGVRLGLGVAIIGTLLAETKLSNSGIGFLIIQAYSLFDMPRMYAMLIVVFVLAISANALIGWIGRLDRVKAR